tara:strand:+ start:813 stop:1148 length:336 start_codon:yes stop_codon:yes gene_type:complete
MKSYGFNIRADIKVIPTDTTRWVTLDFILFDSNRQPVIIIMCLKSHQTCKYMQRTCKLRLMRMIDRLPKQFGLNGVIYDPSHDFSSFISDIREKLREIGKWNRGLIKTMSS